MAGTLSVRSRGRNSQPSRSSPLSRDAAVIKRSFADGTAVEQKIGVRHAPALSSPSDEAPRRRADAAARRHGRRLAARRVRRCVSRRRRVGGLCLRDVQLDAGARPRGPRSDGDDHGRLHQDQSTGKLSLVKSHNVDTSKVHGLWVTCGASLSPWNTHLSSEEYEPDAPFIDGDKIFKQYSRNLFGDEAKANPYHYGHLPEITVHPDGT